MTDIRIETPRLVLDRMVAGDAADLCRIVTIETVGRMLFLFPADWTDAAARELISDWQDVPGLRYRLAIRREGLFVGSVGISDRCGSPPEIYYFLDPAQAGQGLGIEAVGVFLRDVFARTGDASVDAVQADVFTDNPGSARLLERLGFRRDGTGKGTSARRLDPAPVWLYRLERSDLTVPR